MNIFYNQLLNDQLIVLEINENKTNIHNLDNGNIIILNQENKVVGCNIIDVSKKMKLAHGRHLATKELIDFINKEIKPFTLAVYPSGFIVGKIIKCEPIKDSHLHNCVVDIGEQQLEIVCGAKNIKKDLLVVVATINTLMPLTNLLIKSSKLKGFNSHGMICSQKELNINGFNEVGIIELDEQNFKIGQPFYPIYTK